MHLYTEEFMAIAVLVLLFAVVLLFFSSAIPSITNVIVNCLKGKIKNNDQDI
jgi:hypothetical protein